MARIKDPARRARERLVALERQERARAEARAVMDGVAETVALSRARGAAIAEPAAGRRRVCAQPYRKQSGLEWLARKGRLSAAQMQAGARYGEAYRRVKLALPIPSTLNVRPGREDPGGAPLAQVLAHGEGTAQAKAALARLRARLSHQPDLVGACDLICGEEKTPREAAGAERDAGRLEAVLKVALDLMA